jgi:hypothetical protein
MNKNMTLKIRIEWLFSVDSDLVNLVQKFVRDSWNDKITICDKTDEDYDLVLRVQKTGSNRNVPQQKQQQKHNKPVMDLILRNVVSVDHNTSDDKTTYLFYTQNNNPLVSWTWGKYKPTSRESYQKSCTHLKTFFKENYHKSKQASPRDGVGGQVSFVVGMVAAVVLMAVSTIVDNK